MPVLSLDHWGFVLSHIQMQCSPGQYGTWLCQATPVPVDGGTLANPGEPVYIACDSAESAAMIRATFGKVVAEAVERITGTAFEIRFVARSEAAALLAPMSASDDGLSVVDEVQPAGREGMPPPTPPAAEVAVPSARDSAETQRMPVAGTRQAKRPTTRTSPMPRPERAWDDEMALNANLQFDRFVVGPSNRLAHAAAGSVVDAPGTAYNPLYLYGDVGLGKTHLIQAIAHELSRRRNTQLRVMYINCESFVSNFLRACEARTVQAFQRRFRSVDCLIVDDIQFMAGRKSAQEEFFHTFNALFHAQKQIIIASDSAPGEIANLQERLSSRFRCGLMARIDAPNYQTRVEILRQKFRLMGVEPNEAVLCYLAEQFTRSIREMEGAVRRVIAACAQLGREVTEANAAEALSDILRAKRQQQALALSLDRICEITAQAYNVTAEELRGRRRPRHIAAPRQVAMYLARRLTTKTLQEIGGFFGRDHTTVLHSVRQVEAIVDNDSTDAAAVHRLFTRLTGGNPDD
jgi:chromosomal replication initiator protein